MEEADKKFVEAPPLPRYPTVIRSTMPPPPSGAENDAEAAPEDAVNVTERSPTHLVAPPRFPSLVDVDVKKAVAAAEAQQPAEPASAPNLGSASTSSSFTTGPASAPALPASAPAPDDADVETISVPPLDPPVGRELEREINETIKRDQVEPGAALRRAEAAASKQWTSMDQRHLNALLRDAGGQLAPPSPTAHARDSSIDVFPTASIASRVAALDSAADFSAPSGLAEDAVQRSTPSDANVLTPEAGDTLADRSDVERTRGAARSRLGAPPPPAFPAGLATVPMTVFSGPGEEAQVEDNTAGGSGDMAAGPAPSDLSTKHEAMVRSESTNARVDITGDFGLKNGHEGVVRDSAFLGDDTLLTAGEDGKVCMWDLAEKYVRSFFMPYNGNPVQMLRPIVEEDGTVTRSLITLSDDRLLRVWNLVENQAVLLRSMQIPASSRDLVMSIPVLTPQMKAHAAAAAAAAAVAPTDLSESAPPSLDLSSLQTQTAAAAAAPEPAAPSPGAAAAPAAGMTKPFSYTARMFKSRKAKAVAS